MIQGKQPHANNKNAIIGKVDDGSLPKGNPAGRKSNDLKQHGGTPKHGTPIGENPTNEKAKDGKANKRHAKNGNTNSQIPNGHVSNGHALNRRLPK